MGKKMGTRTREFSQVCVWESTLVGEGKKVDEFVEFIAEEFGTRAVYLEEVVTGPGDAGEGGRNDVFFAIHNDDVAKFAVPRMAYGIRWIEDVFDNHSERGTLHIYPDVEDLRERYYGPFKEKSASGPWGTGARIEYFE